MWQQERRKSAKKRVDTVSIIEAIRTGGTFNNCLGISMTVDRDAMIYERKLLRQKYGALFESVVALLFEADPVGINFEENTDEYEPEAGTILCRLTPSCTIQDVETIVHEEFCNWFGVEDAGPIEKYKPVAANILELWREFNQPHV